MAKLKKLLQDETEKGVIHNGKDQKDRKRGKGRQELLKPNPKNKTKKRGTSPRRPKVSLASVEQPPIPIHEELETLWDDQVAEDFGKLNPRQQTFLLAYMRKGNAAEAYRKSYNPLADPHLSTVCGNGILSNPAIGRILHKLTEQKTADLLLVTKTFREMAEATKPEWVQDENGQWQNVGNVPDWKARKDAADGLAKLRGLNAPDKVDATVKNTIVHIIGPAKKPEGHGAVS